jgi:hypothetical protein
MPLLSMLRVRRLAGAGDSCWYMILSGRNQVKLGGVDDDRERYCRAVGHTLPPGLAGVPFPLSPRPTSPAFIAEKGNGIPEARSRG